MEKNDKYSVKIGGFEGPLDLLLFLIKKSEINIYDIPIAEITEQYIEYLNYLSRVDLDNLTDFYHMTATLLYIKSRMLLPMEDARLDEEIEDPRRELVEKLIEYQKFKKLSELMKEREEENISVPERRKNQKLLPFEEGDIWENISVWDLFKTFSGLLSQMSMEKVVNLYEEVTVNEKITLINEYLDRSDDFLFEDLIKNEHSIMEIICAFIAILELVKEKMICIFQNRLFGDIRIRKRREDGNC